MREEIANEKQWTVESVRAESALDELRALPVVEKATTMKMPRPWRLRERNGRGEV